MQGTYDLGLVTASILIATLASYVAIEFAGRMFERRDQWLRWLAGGALAMGSGIWSMHFIGMAAFTLPVPISYDLGITFFSWLIAVSVSALALYLIGQGQLNLVSVGLGALAMGAGICLMHYSGMWAMRMSPGIRYDPVWLGISALIAVGASAAALLIVSALRVVRSWRDVGLRAAAAGIMGLAVAGMHYSGMAAARFDPAAMCSPSNALQGDWMILPILTATLIGLGMAILFAITDARSVLRARREAKQLALRVTNLAFHDRETGLINRPRLSQIVTERLLTDAGGFALASLRVVGANDAQAAQALPVLAGLLARRCDDRVQLARTSPDQLMLLLPDTDRAAAERRLAVLIDDLPARTAELGVQLRVGLALAPQDGDSAQMLMLRAASRAVAPSTLEHGSRLGAGLLRAANG